MIRILVLALTLVMVPPASCTNSYADVCGREPGCVAVVANG